MKEIDQQPKIASPTESTPFGIWLGRALKSCHDDAINEPIPSAILALLPPPTKER